MSPSTPRERSHVAAIHMWGGGLGLSGTKTVPSNHRLIEQANLIRKEVTTSRQMPLPQSR